MVSSSDFWAFDADQGTPSLLFGLDLLDLLCHYSAFCLGKQYQTTYSYDAENEEDIEGVETVSSDESQTERTQCSRQCPERRNQSHSNGPYPRRVQFTHIHLKKTEEERDTSTKDKNHNQLYYTMIASLTILRPLQKHQNKADKRSHRKKYDPGSLSPQFIDICQGWKVDNQLRELDHGATDEDIEAYLVNDQCWSIVHCIGDEGETTACDGCDSQTGESAEIQWGY